LRSFHHLRDFLCGCDQNADGNRDNKGHSHEVSAGNEEHAIDNWRKDEPCYNKVVKKLTELYFVIQLCRREDMKGAMKYDIWWKKYLSKVLRIQHNSF
jgi:hypothetical protein